MAYQNLGKAVPRVEGAEKVTGATRYAADFSLPGTLWGKVLRSPVPHARIVRVDASRARSRPGVHVVLSGADLPPVLIGERMQDVPPLARDRVRYVGEPVAAVAAESPEIAEAALDLIAVEYEELPAVFDPIEALKPGAPPIHEDPLKYENVPSRPENIPNLQSLTFWKRGDLQGGWADAARIFEHTFRTPLSHHGYLEPHACTVRVDAQGQVEIWASNKAPFTLRDHLAHALRIPSARIKVNILSVGGDFGGKSSLIDVPICYFLAERSRKPVKMVLSYSEELLAAAHRHPSVVRLRTGVDRNGALTALEAKIFFSGGAYAGFKHSVEVTVMGARRVGSYYRIPAIHIESRCAYTNHVPCTQMRAPGSSQIVFAVESQMDIIARELGLDPAEFRMRNLLREGDASPLGLRWGHIRAQETLKRALRASGWGRPLRKRYWGRGIAMYERGAATGRSSAEITLDGAGRVTVLTGAPDVGPGIYTVIQQIVSETFGVNREEVHVRVGDTDSLPCDPGIGGSRSTNSTGHAAYKAAREVREKLMALAARHLDCKSEEIRHVRDRFVGPGRQSLSFKEACRLVTGENGGSFSHLSVFEPSNLPSVTSFVAQVAEVEVDAETGRVKVHRITTVHDTGTVLNTLTYQGQVDGGVVMGLGFGLMEETPLVDGRVATLNLGDFKIPTVMDIPSLSTVLLQSPTGPVPYQGKAVAEIPNVPVGAAIANGVADAVGIRFFELPITAEAVHRELRKRG